MEIRNMNQRELAELRAKLAKELKGDDINAERVDEINKTLDAIEERQRELDNLEESRKRAAAVADGAGTPIGSPDAPTQTRTNKEIRNSKEYLDAFANYIKTGKDTECRALLTENVDGVIPVPSFVEGRIRQAWENDEIFSRVAKTFVRGNLRIGFEVSATDAEIHVEGTEHPKEEEIVLGIVQLVPETIKKWITFSTEVMAMGSEEFLAYIYDELTYKIIQKAADIVLEKIFDAPAQSTTEKVGVAQIEGDVSAETIIDAIAALGNNARNNVLIASGSTIATVKKAALSASYAFDPFSGLTVIARYGLDGAVVGDLAGVQANLPEGESVRFVFDELTLAEDDMIKLVGRLYAAIEVVGPKMLAVIGGAESE